VGLKINENNKNQCTYPAVLECLDPAAWMLLPADGWPEMTKLLVQEWLQAVFVKRRITLFMGCIFNYKFYGIYRRIIMVFQSDALEAM
jgi:hypothetical protein